MEISLKKSNRPGKKYMVNVDGKTVHFGASGMSDYTIHKDSERMGRYIARHKNRENWTKSGIKSAGFWSRWLLWNKPSLSASKSDIERRFGVKIKTGISQRSVSRKVPRKSVSRKRSSGKRSSGKRSSRKASRKPSAKYERCVMAIKSKPCYKTKKCNPFAICTARVGRY